MNVAGAISEAVLQKVRELAGAGTMLVGISGIDGSGKTTLAKQVARELSESGLRVALIHADAWLSPPEIRWNYENPAGNFYQQGLRLLELFEQLVLPLKRRGSIRLRTELTRQPENDHFPHTYDFRNVEVILLEGIFIFKQEFRPHFDLAVWLDTSFERALKRALRRNQEGLSEPGIRHDYHTIYFPAQRLHLSLDNPRATADLVIPNEGGMMWQSPNNAMGVPA